MSGPKVVDLAEVELESGPRLARVVTGLRRLAARHGGVVLRHCPQMLAHTLYKTGLLEGHAITLESVREEEPYG